VYCHKLQEEELTELIWKEIYFLGRMFTPKERSGEIDLDDNTFIVAQLYALSTNAKGEKQKWESLWKYVLNTFISEDILLNVYKEFKLNAKSLFVKLYELSSEPTEFVSFYYSYFKNADVIISLSNFLKLDRAPIDLSFYLSSPLSPATYTNYWIFYFPLRFKSHMRGNIIIPSFNFLEIVKENKLESAEFRVYLLEEFVEKDLVHFEIIDKLRRRQPHVPFLENDYLEVIVSQQFFREFYKEIEGVEIEYEDKLAEKLKLLDIQPIKTPVMNYILPVRIVNIKPHEKESVEFTDWTIFG